MTTSVARNGSFDRREALLPLQVIDKLEIGAPRVERRRLSSIYRVTAGGEEREIELAYKYGEDVFDPSDAASVNLASMIAAQVALNYGLFCRELVFAGAYDAADRRFIRKMLDNTSREILVVKLLQSNPFIRSEAVDLPPVRLRSYCLADVHFPDPEPAATPPWEVDAEQTAILSSGGKDSLLTYGLAAEIGVESHPIFINESGRHWLTAFNAHRWFRENVANTTRVWTSADRVFAWMLRHLPFVRQDFANVRADEYPIRLWTVAVFLFGALPVLRKRRVGRLLIGDEHDATVRQTHEGIPHYAGLYDQSRFFDEATTRYFATKRWRVSQFSVLRQLSELLIQKTLAERYPYLFAQQMSCHATHKEGGRVEPCGSCEKCRRIVGMLAAIDVDPGRLGYTVEQQNRCHATLARHGVHQERPGVEHLAHLLSARGLLPAAKLGRVPARERPEILKMRFDRLRSPPECIPRSLRKPLWRILLEHADGAVIRKGRLWVDIDPLTDTTALSAPYAGEAPHVEAESAGGYLLGELTWPGARRRLREVDLALLPVGSIEQHGPHLPLDTDAYDADYLARRVAEACGPPKPLVLPLLPYGVAYHHEDFPGTVSIGPDTLARLVYEIGISLAKQGVTKLVIVNGHGGNAPALKFAAQLVNRDAHIFTAVETGETSDADIAGLSATPNDVHAGEVETSTTLATRPDLVDLDAATSFVPAFSSRYLDFSSKRSVEWFARTSRISKTGVLGDPTLASADKGEQIWKVMIRNLVDFVEQIKTMTLDEIYERRY